MFTRISPGLAGLALSTILLSACAEQGPGTPPASVSPEVAAYNGDWSLSFAPESSIGDQGAQCNTGTGSVTVTNGAIRGRTAIAGQTVVAIGTLAEGGAVTARFRVDQVNVGEAVGMASGDTMTGTFSDAYGCAGDWTATRV